ncbi:trehalose-6-phosphate synthase [Patescibacteria group bacterium]|nr:trehalose-6-phosphate synthase [Patescibacteria group bacterium]MCL5010256.1 trehalose-6-phosphate synthase [Patescibacteria group bacterium]
MLSYFDLKDFAKENKVNMIMASDGSPRISYQDNGEIKQSSIAGGVSLTLEPIAKAFSALYITRARTEEDRKTAGKKISITSTDGAYFLERLNLLEEETDNYYNGFANQTLWPLCHIAFEQPIFENRWYEDFKKVNQKFAKSISERAKEGSFIWVNDYQLSLVPSFLKKPKNSTLAFFWHIPWPTWEIFRILPQKLDILESLLNCDFLGFHRGYQVNNFFNCLDRELPVRIDHETNTVYYKDKKTVVKNLPLGIDIDVINSLVKKEEERPWMFGIIKKILGEDSPKDSSSEDPLRVIFDRFKVIIGVDRLDYTKGLSLRLLALEKFFLQNPKYQNKVVYISIISPSREKIPAYMVLKQEITALTDRINTALGNGRWKPVYLIYKTFRREDIVNFYRQSDLCLVTPRDDGMNLVSKEFVVASSSSRNPGMLVLSRFAGSAIDLTEALIVNPYDLDEMVRAIKEGLEMGSKDKKERLGRMVQVLSERNIYQWAQDFVKTALFAKVNNHVLL